MKVLITGAGGFIGANLASLLATQFEVVAPSRSELDLLDAPTVSAFLAGHRFDAIIHAATERSNRKIGASRELFFHNCRMFFNLARNETLFGKMLFLSSGAVYDRPFMPPRVSEGFFDRHVPEDDYGFSKYVCAKSIGAFPNVYELRLFGVFGPGESWEVRFISNACCRAIWDLPIVIRRNARFDYLDVADLSEILAWFMKANPRHRHYNVCSGRVFELRELAEIVREVSGKALPIQIRNESMAGEYSGDDSRLRGEMTDLRLRSIEASIRGLYRWYESRKQTISPGLLGFDG